VVASDGAGNETQSATVTIDVGDDLPPSSDDGSADDGAADDGAADDGADDGAADGGADDGADDGTEPMGDDDDSLPPGFGLSDGLDDASCACKSGPNRSGSMFSMLVMLFLGAIRRRR